MAPWVRRVFIHILPRLLVMRRPGQSDKNKSQHTAAAAAVMAATAKESAGFDDLVPVSQPILQNNGTSGSIYGSTKMMHVMANDSGDYYKKLLPPPPVTAPVNGGNKHLELGAVSYTHLTLPTTPYV